MTDNPKKNNSKKPDKKSSSSSDKSKYKPVNKKFTNDRNSVSGSSGGSGERGSGRGGSDKREGGNLRKPAGKPNFLGRDKDRDNSDSPRRSYKPEFKKDGERKPFNRDRAPRREGGEDRGERKPFNRSFPRRDGEGSGERKPFNRDRVPRREG